jgi:hypothetical protein
VISPPPSDFVRLARPASQVWSWSIAAVIGVSVP